MKSARTLAVLLLAVLSLAGCAVYEAGPGYYGYRGTYYMAPPPPPPPAYRFGGWGHPHPRW